MNLDGWIELAAYCEKYGELANTVSRRVADGGWQRGVHVAVPEGRTMYVHEGRAAAWLEQHRPKADTQ